MLNTLEPPALVEVVEPVAPDEGPQRYLEVSVDGVEASKAFCQGGYGV